MEIFILHDSNYGNVDAVAYASKSKAEAERDKLNKQSKEIFNSRYHWIVRRLELLEES